MEVDHHHMMTARGTLAIPGVAMEAEEMKGVGGLDMGIVHSWLQLHHGLAMKTSLWVVAMVVEE
jgi:hypothetical protein